MFSHFGNYDSYGVALNVTVVALPGPFIILSMFNSAEHEIYHAKYLCIMLINVKTPIVGILTFRCMINTTPESQFKSKKNQYFFSILIFMSS